MDGGGGWGRGEWSLWIRAMGARVFDELGCIYLV
jgi:hypothetical protein